GDLDAELAGGLHEPPEVFEGAELRVHRVVSARLATDGPRRADVSRLAHAGVVAALAVREPDGVDRREVNHVEAEGRDLRDAPLGVAEGAVAPGLRALGAREQLVPGGEGRLRAIHDDGVEDRAR